MYLRTSESFSNRSYGPDEILEKTEELITVIDDDKSVADWSDTDDESQEDGLLLAFDETESDLESNDGDNAKV